MNLEPAGWRKLANSDLTRMSFNMNKVPRKTRVSFGVNGRTVAFSVIQKKPKKVERSFKLASEKTTTKGTTTIRKTLRTACLET